MGSNARSLTKSKIRTLLEFDQKSVSSLNQPRRIFERQIVAVSFAMLAAFMVATPSVEAKRPNVVHCHKGVCHRVKTLAETRALIGQTLRLRASHYSHCRHDRFNPCGLTSSGERFRANTPDNAASPDLPDGTVVLLFYPGSGKAAVVRINNAGPYWGNRRLDVSRATAVALGFSRKGVADLEVRVLRAPHEDEARYRRHRRYRPVPGFIGTFASMDEAQRALVEVASFRPGESSQAHRSIAAAPDRRSIKQALEAIPLSALNIEIDVLPYASSAPHPPLTRLASLAGYEIGPDPSPPRPADSTAPRSILGPLPARHRIDETPHASPVGPEAAGVVAVASVGRGLVLPRRWSPPLLSGQRRASIVASIDGSALEQAWPGRIAALVPRPAETVVAWAYEDTLIGRLDLIASTARYWARRSAMQGSGTESPRDGHQQALTKYAANEIRKRARSFAGAILGAFEFASQKARARMVVPASAPLGKSKTRVGKIAIVGNRLP